MADKARAGAASTLLLVRSFKGHPVTPLSRKYPARSHERAARHRAPHFARVQIRRERVWPRSPDKIPDESKLIRRMRRIIDAAGTNPIISAGRGSLLLPAVLW